MRFYTRCLFCGGDPGEPGHREACDGRQGQQEAALEPVHPLRNVRTSDPDTSYAAAFANRLGRDTQRLRVYRAIHGAGRHGCTDIEVANRTAIQLNSANKRRGELRDKGLVVDSGRRRATPSGSPAIVWMAAEYAPAEVH